MVTNLNSTAFTLVEMLIVMAIISVVAIVGAGGFLSLQKIQIREQALSNIQSDFEYAKTSALLNKRLQGEGWVWAIGIDLRNWSSSEVEDRGIAMDEYSMVKLCAGTPGYSTPDFEIVDPIFIMDAPDGRVNTSKKLCSTGAQEIIGFEGKVGNIHERVGDILAVTSESYDEIAFVFFETITGKLHIITKDGDEISDENGIIGLGFDQPTIKYIGISRGSIIDSGNISASEINTAGT
jgi:prepilin-type N-terminal cleavage/methylation domain-containing protein